MSGHAVEVVGLTKEYGHGARALDNVSLAVDEGDAVALIGPNGAGKTTLLRILATLLKPTAGYARIFGFDGRFQAPSIRRLMGYMPDVSGIYEDLTVREYLEFFAGAYRVKAADCPERVKSLVELMDLGGVRDSLVGALSRGMQQRLGLARILIHDPRILLLDEPASNLDPRARIEIRELLKAMRGMGKTIIVSSHILMELDQFCNKLVIVDKGKVLYSGAIAEVASKMRRGREVSVKVGRDQASLAVTLRAVAEVDKVIEDDSWLRVRLKDGVTDYSFIVRAVNERGLTLLGLAEEEPDLEDVFMSLTKRSAP